MSRIHKALLAFLMAGVAAVAGAETVYKWVDASGQVHYTDLPPRQAGARILAIVEQGVVDEESGDDYDDEGDDSGSSGPIAGGETDSRPTAATTPEPPPSREAIEASRNDAEKAKVEQCKTAQDRYQRYIDSRRLFREENGKRVYLTDQELAEARARAKQAVDDSCS
jgi:hypothetical protein